MWNSQTCNQSYEHFLRQKESKRLKSSLLRINPTFHIEDKNSTPLPRTGSKKLRLRQEKLKSIESSNQLLLNKMLVINIKPSALNKDRLIPRNSSNSLNFKNRIDSQNKIFLENQKILERLQGTQSVYSNKKWENQFRKHEWLKMTHSKSRILRKVEEKTQNSMFSLCNPGVFEVLKKSFLEKPDFEFGSRNC
jgi:hypothetical protein